MEQLDFHEPIWFALLGLLPVLLLLYWLVWRHRYPVMLVSHTQEPSRNLIKNMLNPPSYLLLLRLTAMVFVILCLANLKSAKATKHITPAEGVDIVLALDVSGSMMLEDIKPNRLEALKGVLTNFIAGRSQDRFGLVLYAGESINWCPLTQDYGFLLAKLNDLEDEALADGTAIGLGLTSAVNALRHSNSKSKVVILLTDGENNTGYVHPLTAAEVAKEHQVKVYTVGIGTTGVAPLALTDINGNKVYQYVQVKIDEPMLREIAKRTGGNYYRAKDAQTLHSIYAEIDKLEKTKTGSRTEIVYHSEYQIFLLIALAIFLIEIILKFTLFRMLS